MFIFSARTHTSSSVAEKNENESDLNTEKLIQKKIPDFFSLNVREILKLFKHIRYDFESKIFFVN